LFLLGFLTSVARGLRGFDPEFDEALFPLAPVGLFLTVFILG